MIQYDNKAWLHKLLLSTRGSVLGRAFIPGFISFSIAFLIQHVPAIASYGVLIEHPLGVQMYSILLGFVLVFRTSMALGRYSQGLSCVQTMGSKWTDAGLNAISFLDMGILKNKGDLRYTLMQRRLQVVHWLSLMHACGVQLVSGYDQVNFDMMYAVDFQDLRKSPESKRNSIIGKENMEEAAAAAALTFDQPELKTPPSSAYAGGVGLENPVNCVVSKTKLRVLGSITADERNALERMNDPVEVISYWLSLSFTQMRQDNWLAVHPAICSRVYQELSKGSLGYWQASKLIAIPFPFPFAQMVTLQLCLLVFLFPVMVSSVIHDELDFKWLAPLFSWLGVASYFGLNIVAVEIEMPFGDDANDLPLVALHEMFVTGLSSLYLAQNHWAALDRDDVMIKRVLRADDIVAELNAMLAKHNCKYMFSPESTRADLRVITQPDLAQKVGFDVAVIVFSRLKQFLGVQNEGVDELLVNT
jgi:predicted membrane chloride channel (bestrophin family)